MFRASQIIGRLSAPSGKNMAGAAPILESEQIVCAAWARAVGTRIARHTRPAKLVRQRLVVEVEDASWQRNLNYLTKHIVSNLSRAVGADVVHEIEFRVVPLRREPQRASSSVTLLKDEAESIADPGLRRLYRQERRKASA